MDIGAGNAGMQHVANDGDGEIRKIFLKVPNGVHVEQALGRVGVSAVTGVDHVHVGCDMLRDKVRSARFAVTHHKNIRCHRAEVGNGV